MWRMLVSILYTCTYTYIHTVSKFSCGRCEKAVRWNQKGVQCDGCDKWHHTSCIDMPASEYFSLSESNISWLCPACSSSAPTSQASWPAADKSAPVMSTSPPLEAAAWSSNFSIVHLNVRSLLGHFDQVLEFVNSYSPDILALSETWLDSSVDDSLVAIPGFRVYRSDRHRHGGGVCMYVNDSLKCARSDFDNNPAVESIWLEISTPSSPSATLTGCVYRPPNSAANCLHSVFEQIDQALALRKQVIVCGDLNVNLLDCSHPQAILLRDYVATRNLLQPIITPTRITDHSATLLDIFLVSARDVVRSASVMDLGISDHSAVSLHLCWRKPKTQSSYVTRRSKRIDLDKFRKDLSLAPWSVTDIFDSVDDKLDYFNQTFLQVLNDHAPLRRVRVKKKRSPWMTREIRDQMDNRNESLRRFRATRSADDWEAYRRLRSRVTTLLRASKRAHFSHLISGKVNPTTLWKALKSVVPPPTSNWSFFPDSVESLAAKFNHYFSSISSLAPLPVESASVCAMANSLNHPTPMSLCPIQPEECQTRLSKLNPRKSTGSDGIPSSMLKIASSVIAHPLCSIINASIASGSFPSSWKRALVKPMHKGGPRDILSNYRPISVLPVASKILEGVVRDQLSAHLEDHNLLSPWQSGFRAGHSTTTALLQVTNDWYSALDQGLVVGVIFLDISKAFDTVNHHLLLSRLREFGLDPATCGWFTSYLADRRQSTSINAAQSEEVYSSGHWSTTGLCAWSTFILAICQQSPSPAPRSHHCLICR